MRKTFFKYINNLDHDDKYVYSYECVVAEIDFENKTLWTMGYWSGSTTKHINYAAKQLGLEVHRGHDKIALINNWGASYDLLIKNDFKYAKSIENMCRR